MENRPCKVDRWSRWSDCSESCGVGKRVRTRSILRPSNNDRLLITSEEMLCVGCQQPCGIGFELLNDE